MASMDDLIATMSGVRAGQHGHDLQDLHTKLQQTIPSNQYYRPIPPPAASSTIPPHSSSSGPVPPPAPASSWNTPTVLNGRDQSNLNFGYTSSPSNGGFGTGTSPLRQTGYINQGSGSGSGSGSNGNIPGPKSISSNGGRRLRSTTQNQNQNQDPEQEIEDDGKIENRPYHNNVLPIKASPKDTGGFEQDAFRPLWNGGQDQGATGGGVSDWGGFQGERL